MVPTGDGPVGSGRWGLSRYTASAPSWWGRRSQGRHWPTARCRPRTPGRGRLAVLGRSLRADRLGSLGLVGSGWLVGPGPEDLGAHPVQGLVQDDAQLGQGVLACFGTGLPGQAPHLADEVFDRVLQVVQQADVGLAREAAAAGPVGPGGPVAPVTVAPGRPGLLPLGAGPSLGVVPDAARALLGLFAGLPGAFPGVFPVPAGPLMGLLGLGAVRFGRARAGFSGLSCVARGPGQLLAQAAHGLADVFLDLPHHVPDRVGQLLLQLGQLVLALVQFLATGLGDAVDLAPVHLVVGDQALFLQPGQPGVDRAGRGGVHAHELVAQHPDHLVPVPRLLVEQPQQVQPEPAVPENRTHRASPFVCASLPSTASLLSTSSVPSTASSVAAAHTFASAASGSV